MLQTRPTPFSVDRCVARDYTTNVSSLICSSSTQKAHRCQFERLEVGEKRVSKCGFLIGSLAVAPTESPGCDFRVRKERERLLVQVQCSLD